MAYSLIVSVNSNGDHSWGIERNNNIIATSKRSFPNEFECLADLHLLMDAIDDFLKSGSVN